MGHAAGKFYIEVNITWIMSYQHIGKSWTEQVQEKVRGHRVQGRTQSSTPGEETGERWTRATHSYRATGAQCFKSQWSNEFWVDESDQSQKCRIELFPWEVTPLHRIWMNLKMSQFTIIKKKKKKARKRNYSILHDSIQMSNLISPDFLFKAFSFVLSSREIEYSHSPWLNQFSDVWFRSFLPYFIQTTYPSSFKFLQFPHYLTVLVSYFWNFTRFSTFYFLGRT